jgi:hypothetical protein
MKVAMFFRIGMCGIPMILLLSILRSPWAAWILELGRFAEIANVTA